MKYFTKAVFASLVLLMAAMPALACHVDPPDIDPAASSPAAISLYNNAAGGEADSITLFALNMFDSGEFYGLAFDDGTTDDWQSFNPLMGPLFGNELNMSAVTFDQAGRIDLNLGLADCTGEIISETAEVTFHSFQSQMDGYDWFNWVELNWLDEEDTPLNVSTVLSAWLPWDSEDMVGTTAVPIPGTGLLLSLGLLCLIGRRSRQ